MRIGIGYDVHLLVEGRKLMLGGVEVSFNKGLLGHSDADVLLHAICDASLGAAGEGDIGCHFPTGDPQYKNISSLILLQKVSEIIAKKRMLVNNIDVTVVAEEPRLSSYINAMKEKIAIALNIEKKTINIKATTTEGLGFIGKGEGMAAYAVVSLKEF
ncbi:2-C-methyl-D-erythritol 2,4-cyclodiphosphate synthase [candidate division NPL-UPA2 bacterium Unc8]|uniref:2-C-methyl-D-erythritol 2,4-cyclodiphosphate synthase n=1 Tax=candidate division NPL-UPA2 bacterium Unc8 TaxID=1980939 RepID=A0A399FXB4_UNCN2|nr:2-C-methyl-D-erythritol 2,4-cyclodiphosphate synthase [Bacillota bacterium]RIH99782.1 MAG: 2-C-methyl-D-erythritol 2,4-cyclodiphosphate synthase [candidate division NPL-UPA2 bacterium Unc8]